MATFFNWICLATALLAVAHGASVATSKDSGNCTLADGFQAITCLIRMNDFINKIDELDIDDKEEVKEFKRSCDSLEVCIASIGKCEKAGEKDKESEEIPVLIKSYCDAVVYMSNEFSDCSDKLEAKNSKCFDEWDPFPDSIENEKNEQKKEELKKEACKNLFGKENCLEKEIKDTCSEKEWIGFKNNFLKLNTIMKQCEV